jgi:uncharacterized protein YbjT (DUF2867 family)
MSERKIILVTGASGKTGRRCIAHLLRQDAAVRALVRRHDVADELRAQGVADVVVGDMFEVQTMQRALEGARKVLHICPPMHPGEDKLASDMIAVARNAGVEHFVLWSVLHPHIDVPHHRRKQKAEAALIESGLTFTILQPGRYMQHLETIWTQVREAGIHTFPFSTSSRFSIAHLDDLAEVAALVLTGAGHENAVYELAGPQALSQADCAHIISGIIGRDVRAEAMPLDQFLNKARTSGLPEWRIETFDAMNRHYDRHGLEGNGNVLRWLLARAPRSFEDFVSEISRC